MQTVKAKFKEGAKITIATSGASGYDLHAYIKEPIILKVGERKLIPTGVFLQMEKGLEAQVRPRSGLALKYGVTVLNTPGTIDSDYRGEIGVILINFGEEDFTIEPDMRIAQLVFSQVAHPEIIVVKELEETARGAGGFNSTGLK